MHGPPQDTLSDGHQSHFTYSLVDCDTAGQQDAWHQLGVDMCSRTDRAGISWEWTVDVCSRTDRAENSYHLMHL